MGALHHGGHQGVQAPSSTSMGSGQVLQCPYTFDKARLVVREMADLLALDLLDQRLVTDQLVLTVGYDRESLGSGRAPYQGEVTTDRYGRAIPKHAHGTANLDGYPHPLRRSRLPSWSCMTASWTGVL